MTSHAHAENFQHNLLADYRDLESIRDGRGALSHRTMGQGISRNWSYGDHYTTRTGGLVMLAATAVIALAVLSN